MKDNNANKLGTKIFELIKQFEIENPDKQISEIHIHRRHGELVGIDIDVWNQ